jgi:hypothetical protein
LWGTKIEVDPHKLFIEKMGERSPYNNIRAAFFSLYGAGVERYMLAAYLANNNHYPGKRVAPTVPSIRLRITWRSPAEVDQELAQEAARLTEPEKEALREMWRRARDLYEENIRHVN